MTDQEKIAREIEKIKQKIMKSVAVSKWLIGEDNTTAEEVKTFKYPMLHQFLKNLQGIK